MDYIKFAFVAAVFFGLVVIVNHLRTGRYLYAALNTCFIGAALYALWRDTRGRDREVEV